MPLLEPNDTFTTGKYIKISEAYLFRCIICKIVFVLCGTLTKLIMFKGEFLSLFDPAHAI